MINVSIGRVPGTLSQVALASGTVRDALQAAGLQLGANEEIQVDGSPATEATTLSEDSSTVYILAKIKGN